jgi:hypothetical protein
MLSLRRKVFALARRIQRKPFVGFLRTSLCLGLGMKFYPTNHKTVMLDVRVAQALKIGVHYIDTVVPNGRGRLVIPSM